MPRLLIVDDRAEICEVIEIYLKELGHTVVTTSDGAWARSALERETFDGLIADVVLPGVSGLTIADAASARGIPVLLISGEPNTIEKLNRNGLHLFLQKPFHLEELGSALRALLSAGTGLANTTSIGREHGVSTSVRDKAPAVAFRDQP